MTRVLIASLSIEDAHRFKDVDTNNFAYSIGIIYLHSVLERDGCEVKTLFLNNHSFDDSDKIFFDAVNNFKPDIVALQIFGMTRVSSYRAIEKLNKHYPHIKIIVGGIHVSAMYEGIVKKYPSVVAVIGEGELTVSELVKAMQINTPYYYENIDGIAFMLDGQFIKTKQRELIKDLDSLPFPKFEVYFEGNDRNFGHIISTRGCPYECSFCCLKLISQHRYRKRSIANVVEEIKTMKAKYPRLKRIQFHDDTFITDNKRVIEFCKAIIPLNLGIEYECVTRVKPISPEVFSWMKRANFKYLIFGLETGSPKLLKSIHKDITTDDYFKMLEMIKPYDFEVSTLLMCGFMGESDDTINETIALIQKAQKIQFQWIYGCGKLLVYPGTEVYQNMKDAGKIDDTYWLTDYPVPLHTVEHSTEKLCEFENKVLNHVSFTRALTWEGFKHYLIPNLFTFIRFIIVKKKVTLIISNAVKPKFPRLFRTVQQIYNKVKR